MVCKRLMFGWPCWGRTHGPLIKSLADDLPKDSQEELSSVTGEDL